MEVVDYLSVAIQSLVVYFMNHRHTYMDLIAFVNDFG